MHAQNNFPKLNGGWTNTNNCVSWLVGPFWYDEQITNALVLQLLRLIDLQTSSIWNEMAFVSKCVQSQSHT